MAGSIEITVNGDARQIEAPASTSLLEALRNDLGLTGAKYGCGESQCGACTVLLDGLPVRSCQTALSAAKGKPVTTIEGLADNGKLHPVQQAFLDEQAMQCGYCTAGMILSAVGLLNSNPNPTEGQIREHMQGNVCRCCTYPRIVAAIQRAAKAMRGEE
jgi:aerobic-type carbon monoxide dehydrogenase small subunit (CoxS/CutS family)